MDLRRSHIEEIDPRREWRKAELKDGESITIWPGQVVMARIYEGFKIPERYAGKIEGRSRYARIGLAIHCTGDFINPGWSGFMPLQLVNASVERLHSNLGNANVPAAIQNEIVDLVRFQDVEMLGRFERFVARKRVGQVDNASTLLDEFASKEGRRRWLDRLAAAPFGFALALSVGLLTVPYELWHVAVWMLTAFLSLGAVYSVHRRDGEYLDPRRLAKLRTKDPNAAESTG